MATAARRQSPTTSRAWSYVTPSTAASRAPTVQPSEVMSREWIAQEIFRVTLEENAVQKGFDGRFADGPLVGKTVNVKWYGKREGLLDINPAGVPDYYLVMTGPKAVAMTSKGQTRPLVITEVFLFDAPALVKRLPRLGVAASVRQHEWEAARVYPEAAPRARLTLTDAQREALELFR